MKPLYYLVLGLLFSMSSFASDVTIPNTFSNGQVADADQINANFSAIETAVDDNDARITELESRTTQVFRYSQVDFTGTSTWTDLAYTSFVFNKASASSRVKITWTDTIRAGYNGAGTCAWHLTIDGSACSPSPLLLTIYSAGYDLHTTASTTQICEGLSAGSHTLLAKVRLEGGGQCYRGYLNINNDPLGVGSFPSSIIVEEIE